MKLSTLLFLTPAVATAFSPSSPITSPRHHNLSSTSLSAEIFDSIFGPKEAQASHILLKGNNANQQCEKLKDDIYKTAMKRGSVEGGIKPEALMTAFSQVASRRSTCPSKSNGGSLGTFTRGEMVPEFDAVAFGKDIGVIHGPVETQFGSHLILVTGRK